MRISSRSMSLGVLGALGWLGSVGSADAAFPKGFKWCVSTAAHQIEGGNDRSDWWDWEQIPGKIKHGDKSGPATDHWNRIDTDIGLMKDLGVQQYRLSVEWAKIEPRQGAFDRSVLRHYKDELAAIRRAGIEPLVTFQHFTLPSWVAAKGGWEWAGIADAFARYVEFIYPELGGQSRDWVTINEPTVMLLLGYFTGEFPPGEKRPMSEIVPALEGMLRSHAAAWRVVKRVAKEKGWSSRVGIAHSVQIFDPKDWWNPLHHWASGEMHKASNWTFMDALETGKLSLHIPYMVDAEKDIPGLKGTQDFIGLNYYTRYRISVNPMAEQKIIQSVTPGAPVNDMGWEIFPEGMYRIVTDTAKRFKGKPILITENGLADAADSRRKAFLEDHLSQLERAMKEGAPVEAYCHWSLIDNFEWAHGFGPRFGLYEVNYSNFKRTPRASAHRYAEIIRKNGLSR